MGMIKNLIKKLFKKKTPLQTKKPVVQLPHQTVPAPVVLSDDSWFGKAPKTENSHKVQVTEPKQEKPQSKEVDNIHQVMYDKATKGIATTLSLDPLGGSEGWQSGTGYNQFRG
jgi:hypothetical protein